MERKKYETCLNVLKEELIPAMGCTEPVAVAYAAALARDALGAIPERAEVAVSGNILKNVKSVVVPNTGGLRGVAVAVAAGIVAGDASKGLEALSAITAEEIGRIAPYMQGTPIAVKESDSGCVFDIGVRVFCGADEAFVRIAERHTNVVRVEKNGEVLRSGGSGATGGEAPKADFSVKDIVEFADTVALSDVEETLGRQISCNSAICEEGLKTDYGARVGKILLSAFGNDVHNRAKATAAAGSDARMNGCELPVVIVSGSGNQGITASVPVIVYAKELGVPHEKLLRALVVSNLVTVHLKRGIGCLSAYCGAVSAGCGAGAGVCYLHGGNYEEIAHTIVNALAIESGVICDGAKSSCAAKVASAVEAGLVGMEMYRRGSEFIGGDGIVEKGVENTIRAVGDLARNGMRETDEEIIRLMIRQLA